MNEPQMKAWDCLLKAEQQALFLQFSEGKSSWEAGEILKIAHYKYIEIRERSTKFFKLLTDFFEKHPAIFNPNCPCSRQFQDYIEGCIEKRMTTKEASMYTGDSAQLVKRVSSKHITRNMKKLRKSKDEWDLDTARLIFEFDRWNNFRILPVMLQQPSAFKRRLNKKDKIYIKYLLNPKKFPNWLHEKLVERFKYKGRKRYWVALISEHLYTDGYLLLPVKIDDWVVQELSRFYMYVFREKDDADTFGFMVSKFMMKTRTIQLGQNFWPEYRSCIEKAVNYNQVNNIEFSIKRLDVAYNTHVKRKPKTLKSDAAPRAKAEAFYIK